MRGIRASKAFELGMLACLLVVCLVGFGLSPGVAAQSTSDGEETEPDLSGTRVLVLHSYHLGFTWADNVNKGIRAVFAEQAGEVELLFEFMDVKRLYTDAYLDQLHSFYRFKYAGRQVDLIIVSDDHALEFLLGRGQDLFPDVPIVFCAVNGYDPAKHHGGGRPITGVVESIDIRATLDVALQLHPSTKQVAVITDRTLTGRALRADAEAIFQDYRDRVDFKYIEHLTIDQLQREIAALPAESIVFAFIFSQDRYGRVFSHEYNMQRLANYTDVPIYSVWEFYLGHGIVGGMLTSGQAHGRLAADMALRILQGESAADIPVVLESPNQYMFDHEHMERFDIQESRLPPDSVIVNTSSSFYEQYRTLVWGVGAVFTVMLTVLVGLVLNIAGRRRAESQREAALEALRESEEMLSNILLASSVGIAHARDRSIIWANEAMAKIFGFTEEGQYLGKETRLLYANDEEYERVGRIAYEQQKTGQVLEFDAVFERQDGSFFDGYVRVNTLDPLDPGKGIIVSIIDVTERKRAEQALKESEERYRILFEQANDAIFVEEIETDRIVDVNRRACELLGYTRQQLLSMRVADLQAPEMRGRNGQIIQDELERHEGKPFEALDLHRDGRRIPVEVTTAPMAEPLSHLSLSIVRDITERKQAEQALQESEERYRMLVQNSADIIVLLAADGTVRDVSPSVQQILGYPPQHFMGQDPFQYVHPQDVAAARENFGQAVQQPGQPVSLAFRLRHAAGHWVYLETITKSFLDKPGVEAILVNARDVSERKRAAEEILRLQHLLQNITDSMPSALITLDPQGQVLTWNPAAEALTGKTAEQMQGQFLWGAGTELSRYQSLFEEVLREGRVAQRHKEQWPTDTGTLYRDVSVFPLETNELEGVVLRVDDVTRRVQLEEIMLQSAKMASVGGLAAGVAHEINNPLGAMMQGAQVLHMTLNPQRQRSREQMETFGVEPDRLGRYLRERGVLEYLDGIRAAGERAAKIVTDLLSFSRRPSSQLTPQDVNDLVEQALALAVTDYDLKKKYDFRAVEVVRQFASDLPPVVCDGQQIQQVILNLVRNAAQAMAEEKSTPLQGTTSAQPPFGKNENTVRAQQAAPQQPVFSRERARDYQPRLTLRTRASPGWVRLEVEDNGPGIPESASERLFEPFFTTKEVGEGTGLGLWLCWSIVVERHGGRIWAESEEGEGARFIVELPIHGPPQSSDSNR